MAEADSILARLMAVIEERKRTMPENSYTTRLFARGVEKIGEKIAWRLGLCFETWKCTYPDAAAARGAAIPVDSRTTRCVGSVSATRSVRP